MGEDVFTHYMDSRLQFKYAAFFQAPPNSFFQQVSVCSALISREMHPTSHCHHTNKRHRMFFLLGAVSCWLNCCLALKLYLIECVLNEILCTCNINYIYS